MLGGFIRRARLLRQAIEVVEISLGMRQLSQVQSAIPLRSVPTTSLSELFPCISNCSIAWRTNCSQTYEEGGIAEFNEERGIMKSKLEIVPISNPRTLSENIEEGILSHNLLQM